MANCVCWLSTMRLCKGEILNTFQVYVRSNPNMKANCICCLQSKESVPSAKGEDSDLIPHILLPLPITGMQLLVLVLDRRTILKQLVLLSR
jgi:hypothetical protein